LFLSGLMICEVATVPGMSGFRQRPTPTDFFENPTTRLQKSTIINR